MIYYEIRNLILKNFQTNVPYLIKLYGCFATAPSRCFGICFAPTRPATPLHSTPLHSEFNFVFIVLFAPCLVLFLIRAALCYRATSAKQLDARGLSYLYSFSNNRVVSWEALHVQ